jgi:type 1 glutamine amidotransferase
LRYLKPTVLIFATFLIATAGTTSAQEGRGSLKWHTFQGDKGPGRGKHIVFLSSDPEYRSEETASILAKILAKRHGFRTTVLYNHTDGQTFNPQADPTNIPGLHALKSADLMVIFIRFANLPDEQMALIDEYINSGKPIVGIRTATHAFRVPDDSKYAHWNFRHAQDDPDDPWFMGFGEQVLGNTWAGHWGKHGTESTRGVITAAGKKHPILKGVKSMWCATDVYGVKWNNFKRHETTVLVEGQVLAGMEPDSPVSTATKDGQGHNDPMMPVAWTKTYTGSRGKAARVFTSTVGASMDIMDEGIRRMLINGAYWALGMEDMIKAKSNVDLVVPIEPGHWHKPKRGPAKSFEELGRYK